MQPITNFSSTLQDSALIFTSNIISFLPSLLAGILILAIGFWIAHLLRNLIVRSLERFQLSKGVEHTPISAFLANAEVKSTIESIIGGAVYWLIILFVLYMFASVLHLEAATTILNSVVFFIPRIVSAILILLVGTLLAGLAETVVKGAVRSIDVQSSRILAKVASYTIVVIAIMACISELGIAQQFITVLFTGFVAAVALALGLAFGLGSKDIVHDLMDEWYKRIKKS